MAVSFKLMDIGAFFSEGALLAAAYGPGSGLSLELGRIRPG